MQMQVFSCLSPTPLFAQGPNRKQKHHLIGMHDHCRGTALYSCQGENWGGFSQVWAAVVFQKKPQYLAGKLKHMSNNSQQAGVCFWQSEECSPFIPFLDFFVFVQTNRPELIDTLFIGFYQIACQ